MRLGIYGNKVAWELIDPHIVKADIEVKNVLEAVKTFGAAPGSSSKALQIVPHHRASVIQEKEGIVAARL